MRHRSKPLDSLARQLTRKVLWLSLMGLVGLGGGVILSLVVTLQHVQQRLERASITAARTFDPLFLELKSDLLATSASLSSGHNVENLLRQMRSRNRYLLQVQMLNQNGDVIAHTGHRQQQQSIQIPESVWSYLRGQVDQIYISPLHFEANTPYVEMATVTTNPLGVTKGLLVTRVDLTELWRQTLEQQVLQTGYVYIVDQQGRVVAASNLSWLGDIPHIHILEDHPGHLHIHRGIKGGRVFSVDQPLQLIPWYVIVEQPVLEALSPFLWPAGVGFAILIAGVILILRIMRFTQERIVAPLNALNQGVADLREGQLTEVVGTDHNDELGRLASAFNSMAIQLRASLEELERRVRKRTVQLEMTNKVLEQEVTQHQATSDSLQQVLQKLSFHFNNSPLAVIEWDQDFKIKSWSKQAEALFGWTISEVMGKSWRDWRFVFETDLDQAQEIEDTLLAGLKPRTTSQYRNYSKQGEVLDCEWYNSALLDSSGRLMSIFSLVLDVSDRKQTEDQLRESEQRYSTLITTVPVGIFRTDAAGCFIYVNDRYCEITGMTRENSMGRGWGQWLHPDDRDWIVAQWELFFQAPHSFSFHHEYRFQRPDGTIKWVYGQAIVEYDADGE